MRLLKLQSQQRKLEVLFDEVSKLEEDDFFKPHLSKYLCVQVTGFLENVIKELLFDFHDHTCKYETMRFINNKLKNYSAIKHGQISDLLNSFSKEWDETYLNSFPKEISESLNSVVAQRHLIAHGQEAGSNITYSQISKYFGDLKIIISELENIIKK